MNPTTTPPSARPVPASDRGTAMEPEPREVAPRPQRGRIAEQTRFVLFNIIVPVALLVVGGSIWWALGSEKPAVAPPDDQTLAGRLARIPEVETLPVRSLESVGGRLDLEVEGVVVPFREVQIATEVAGRIVHKAAECEAGSYVQEGQLLFRIDPTDYQNEIERLTKLKEQEYQSIRELDQEVINTNRLIEVAEQDVQLQEREIERLRSLPAGFASQTELDQAQRARLQAFNSLVGLQNERASLQQRRARLEAAEQLVETQLELARTNLERTEIRSPVSGVVFREDAELNSFVQRGTVIVTIEDTSRAEAAVNLRMDQLYWVLDQAREDAGSLMPTASGDARSYSLPQTAASIEYRVAGRENEVFRWEGMLERYDGIGVDTVSRTVPVRVVVEEPRRYGVDSGTGERRVAAAGPSALVRGMFVTVVLHVVPQRPLVVLPAVGLKPGNRVWKFVPDPTVVTAPADPDTEHAEPSSNGDAGGEVQPARPAAEAPVSTGETNAAELGERIDPKDWIAGRLEVIEEVRPIEASELRSEESPDDSRYFGDESSRAYWICEVGRGSLEPGERIIVSPLPSFEGNGTDVVRVPAAQVDPPGGAVP